MEPIHLESQPDDGLFTLVNRAAEVVAGEDRTHPVGVLKIDLDAGELEGADIQIEAAFAHKGLRRVIQRLDVHARARLDHVSPVEFLGDALPHFGGRRFTNICLSSPGAAETRGSHADVGRIVVPETGLSEMLDLTVYFPSRVSFYAKHLALLSDGLGAEELDAVIAVLRALGVREHHRGSTLRVTKRQLRALVTHEEQIAAYREAQRRALAVSLYAATLPATQSMRVAETRVRLEDGSTTAYVDCHLSHGLTPDSMSTLSDAAGMQQILTHHFSAELGGRRWKVVNSHSEPDQDSRPAARRPHKWTMTARRG